MMYQSTLSIQGQTTIPAPIRDQLGLEAGYKMLWETIKDRLGIDYIKITLTSPTSLKSLRGVGKKLYQKYGSGNKYLALERASWDKKSI